jgi:hypothetical protein
MTIAHDVSAPQLDQPVGGQLTDLQVAWKMKTPCDRLSIDSGRVSSIHRGPTASQ